MILEICANSYQSAINAQIAGADRIELCSELAAGGITPSYGLIKKVINELSIPVFILIRPRSGNFTYTNEEFQIMKEDILLCKGLGCQGIVSGILNEDHTIDLERTKELMELSEPLAFTFHRAFDCVPNPTEALDQLIELGADRILSSGLENSAENGLELLIQLKEKANNRITILPGSGINPKNAVLFKNAGFEEIHSSASKPIKNTKKVTQFDAIQTESNVAIIKSILKVCQK